MNDEILARVMLAGEKNHSKVARDVGVSQAHVSRLIHIFELAKYGKDNEIASVITKNSISSPMLQYVYNRLGREVPDCVTEAKRANNTGRKARKKEERETEKVTEYTRENEGEFFVKILFALERANNNLERIINLLT